MRSGPGAERVSYARPGRRPVERLLRYLLLGSRGGPTRLRILEALLQEPLNLNRLAKRLDMDYKTIEHNVRVLVKHVVVVCPDKGSYGATYHPSKNLLANRHVVDRILEKARRADPPPSRNRENIEKRTPDTER